ncbi:uncharacterized protein [Dendrobates tinctorius]|uniref:uncharacterized protein n=1 Tax=Dendrobates tinctorius TaxID=92724 RepID=UPI003CC92AA8
MRRWCSIRDQYRRERQQRARSGSGAHTKRKYVYFDRLSFLAPIVDLRPTHSNITERETGSESEAIDPVGGGVELSGPSCELPRSQAQVTSPARPDPALEPGPPPETPPPGTEPQQGPSAASPPNIHDEQGNSSSPTVSLEGSPQPAVPSRRHRQRRHIPATDTTTNVDTGAQNFSNRVATDDGEEEYSRSLAHYLRSLPREVLLRVRGSIQILIDVSTHPKTPYELFEFLERWQLSSRNLMPLNPHPQVVAQSGSEDPPTRGPTPHPLPPPSQHWQHHSQMSGNNPAHQYGHLFPANVGGLSQSGWRRHGHFGGLDSRPYQPQQESHLQYSAQYPPQAHEPAHYLHHGQEYAPTQAEAQGGHAINQATQAGLPPSPPPTYYNL